MGLAKHVYQFLVRPKKFGPVQIFLGPVEGRGITLHQQEKLCTLVYRIDVHARLLILRKKSPLHGLILVCTFIDFEKKLPPARLFHPARLFVGSKFHS